MAVLISDKQQGGVAPCRHAQSAAGFVEVAIDGVLRDPQTSADLLGLEMLGDETQALTLPWREFFDRGKIVKRPHDGEVNPPLRFRPCLSCSWVADATKTLRLKQPNPRAYGRRKARPAAVRTSKS